jgi:hypothetical protein
VLIVAATKATGLKGRDVTLPVERDHKMHA